MPALINLGNIRFVARDYKNALALYQRARNRDAKNATALLGVVRAHAALGNDSDARTAFEALVKLSPDLAKQYAYLQEPASDSARAASREPVMRTMVWAEGEAR